MTNWMTAAGLALIAGGLATLISFRSLLFGRGERRARRRSDRALEARCRPALPGPQGRAAGAMAAAALPAGPMPAGPMPAGPMPAAFPAGRMPEKEEAGEVAIGARSRRARRGRRRALAMASREHEIPLMSPGSDEDDRGGLASIGFADEEDAAEPAMGEDAFDSYADSCVDAEEDVAEDDESDAGDHDEGDLRRTDRYGDRVEGWVRPEYRDQPGEPRPGEYWTPIPVDLAGDPEPSAKGYGWPRPVERLPAVPDYEPATGFDLIPVVSEPTEVVPAWPLNDDRPGRIRLPRSWANRNEKPARDERPARNEKAARDEKAARGERPARSEKAASGEKLERPPATERRRPRPRPRPEPPTDRSTTVYVSRHAADPPPPPRQGR